MFKRYIHTLTNIFFTLQILVQFYNSSFNLTLGNNATIQCLDLFSLVGITVQWTDSDGINISNMNTIKISNVIPSLHNTLYTCTAIVDTNPESCGTENKTISINVKSM